ncbi:28774_t:CDS:2, partial [Gigaspora margarita]
MDNICVNCEQILAIEIEDDEMEIEDVKIEIDDNTEDIDDYSEYDNYDISDSFINDKEIEEIYTAEEDSNFIFKPICCIAVKLNNERLGKELLANALSYNFKYELLDVDVKNTNIYQKILGSNHIISFSQYMKHQIQKLERMLDSLDNNLIPKISVSSYIKEKQNYIKQIENLEKENKFTKNGAADDNHNISLKKELIKEYYKKSNKITESEEPEIITKFINSYCPERSRGLTFL